MFSRTRSWRSDEGQALIEFALGLPVLLLATFYALALLDAVATQEAIEAGVRREAVTLAGSNVDAQAVEAARVGWLRGQDLGTTITPADTTLRCAGASVAITLSASGHLGFLLPIPRAWGASETLQIENEGTQAARCALAAR